MNHRLHAEIAIGILFLFIGYYIARLVLRRTYPNAVLIHSNSRYTIHYNLILTDNLLESILHITITYYL